MAPVALAPPASEEVAPARTARQRPPTTSRRRFFMPALPNEPWLPERNQLWTGSQAAGVGFEPTAGLSALVVWRSASRLFRHRWPNPYKRSWPSEWRH